MHMQAPAAAPAYAGGAAAGGGAGGANMVGDDGLTGVQRAVAAVYKLPENLDGQGVHNDRVRPAVLLHRERLSSGPWALSAC